MANDETSITVKKPGKFLDDLKIHNIVWFALTIAFIVVIVLIMSTFINDASWKGGDWASDVVGWMKNASLNPLHKTGFRNFLRLTLTAVCLWVGIYFLKKQ